MTAVRIVITDELLKLKESVSVHKPSTRDRESRWRLVETRLGRWVLTRTHLWWDTTKLPALFFVRNELRERIDVTSCRAALDGYQKGKCFYCFRDISIVPGRTNLADIDHFIPHTLVTRGETHENLNGVWNLVLACRDCKQREKGKSARVPRLVYLERLHKRNTFLVDSHHPLRETLIGQSGATAALRQRYLQQQYDKAKLLLIHEWSPAEELEAAF